MSACINEIPAGLPALPPVPAGWDAWEYMGKGWRSQRPVAYGYCDSGNRAQWHVYNFISNSCGGSSFHYIRAVKLPAKKPNYAPPEGSVEAADIRVSAKKSKAKKDPALPEGLPMLPAGLKYRGLGNGGEWDGFSGAYLSEGKWVRNDGLCGLYPNVHYAIEMTRAKRAESAKSKPRRESRVSRIATVIQRVKTGELPSAQEGAKLVERIYDNSQRDKRRKEGK